MYSCRRQDLSFVFSETLDEIGVWVDTSAVEIVVLPAVWLTKISNIMKDKRLPKVIAFGSLFFMKQAFLCGCADYLKDPWDLEEFSLRLDRVAEILRREQQYTCGALQLSDRQLSCGAVGCELTYQEACILGVLISHHGEIVPRTVLFHTIGGCGGNVGSRVIDMHISSLRKKILSLTPTVRIRTVRSQGYCLDL